MQQDNIKPTIDEVAKICEVSKTTISRYLNGKYEYMSEETRKRIHRIIDELDYRPSNIARSLKSNKSGLIGVIIADISNPFSSILVKGIGDICKEKGYMVIIANTDNDPNKEREYIKSLIDNRVEGLIVNTTGKNNDFLLELGNQGLPIVLADRCMKELKFDTVSCNNYEITFNTIKYLIKNGFDKIALFTPQIESISSRYIRKNAFLDAIKQFTGIDASEMVYIIDLKDKKQVDESILTFVEKYKDFHKAMFAVNGVTLISALQAIHRLDLKIPTDIAICGYDDLDWAPLIPPGITTINQPSYEVGAQSAKFLIERMNKVKGSYGKPKLLQLQAQLMVRGSTELK